MSQSCQIVHVDSDSDRGTPVQQSRCCRKCRLAERQFVPTVSLGAADSHSVKYGDYHVTAQCIKTPVQNERDICGSHKAG